MSSLIANQFGSIRLNQDALVGQLRLCLKEALNNIVGTTTEYL